MLTRRERSRIKRLAMALEDTIVKRYGKNYKEQYEDFFFDEQDYCMENYINYNPSDDEVTLMNLVDALDILQWFLKPK